MSQMTLFAIGIVTYLVGSIPVAYLASRVQGRNVLDVGTGNPGAANTFRKIGRGTGVIVFLWDFGKAVIPMVLLQEASESSDIHVFFVGAAAMAGHCYPIFFRFRGGMGLATAFGIAVGLFPVLALIHGAAMLLILPKVRDVVITATIGYISFCAFGLWAYSDSWYLIILVCMLPVLAAVKNHFTKESIAPQEQ